MRILGIVGSLLLFLVVLGVVFPAGVQADAAKDTPYFTRLSIYDALKDSYKAGEQGSYQLWSADGAMGVTGIIWSTTYTIKNGSTPISDLDIISRYTGEIIKKDGSITFDGRDDSGRRYIAGKFVNNNKKVVWVEVVAWNGGDDYRITVIENR